MLNVKTFGGARGVRECKAFAVIRKRIFKVNSLINLFENVKIDNVLSFLREAVLYTKNMTN